MNNLQLLIVDDDEATRTLVKRVAETIEFNSIAFAVDGKDALNKIKERKPDILVLDWEMPEMNGLAVLKELNRQKLHKEITIMMLTVCKERAVIEEAVRLGACDYIVKPMKVPLLKDRLEKLIVQHSKRTIANLMDNFK